MEKKNILTADFLDLLFDGRNKDYGAYDLRKTYNKRISYALAGTTLVCLLFIAGSIWANAKRNKNTVLVIGPTVVLENLKQAEPKPEEPKPIPPKEQVKVATTQYVIPKIAPDEDVKPEDEMKDMQALEDTKIGNMNQEGAKDIGIVTPPVVEAKGTDVAKAPQTKDEDLPFTSVQIEASFNGGPEAWRKFLERNLNSDLPAENGAPAGTYTVIVSFIVNREGKISDVKAENDPGYGTKDEAVRVIRKGPDWKPAEQNGRKVIYRHRQSIAFKVNDNE